MDLQDEILRSKMEIAQLTSYCARLQEHGSTIDELDSVTARLKQLSDRVCILEEIGGAPGSTKSSSET